MGEVRLTPFAVVLACLLSATVSAAQDSAAAEALFQNGLSEMDQGNLAAACPSLAESYRLDSRPGTLFTLAECESQAGRFASASAHYNDYLQLFSRMSAEQQSRQTERERIAREQITVLAPKIPHLILVLPSSAAPGTLVFRDDMPLSGPSLGIPLPVDPGPHRIVVHAPNRPQSATTITISPGETRHLSLPIPAAAPAAPSALPLITPQSPAPTQPDRTPAYILGAVGLEGLAVGAITGLLAWQKKATVERECVEHLCSPEGKSAADSAQTLGLISTSSLVLATASLLGAAILWPKAPQKEPIAPLRALRTGVHSDAHSGAILSVGGQV